MHMCFPIIKDSQFYKWTDNLKFERFNCQSSTFFFFTTEHNANEINKKNDYPKLILSWACSKILSAIVLWKLIYINTKNIKQIPHNEILSNWESFKERIKEDTEWNKIPQI